MAERGRAQGTPTQGGGVEDRRQHDRYSGAHNGRVASRRGLAEGRVAAYCGTPRAYCTYHPTWVPYGYGSGTGAGAGIGTRKYHLEQFITSY